jgi:hypothetical protein
MSWVYFTGRIPARVTGISALFVLLFTLNKPEARALRALPVRQSAVLHGFISGIKHSVVDYHLDVCNTP